MEQSLERQGLDHLAKIEEELEEIKERTPGPRRTFLMGIFQGAGALVGGIAALVLLGWVLSLFGLIPGFGYITTTLQDATAHFTPR